MSIKLKAVERKLQVGQNAGEYRYFLQAELYNRLSESKVITEAALRSGIPRGTISSSWAAIGEVIGAWATEGHSVAIPGLGTMRFGVRAASVNDVNKVATSLITSRRVIFTPTPDIKRSLAETTISITCYDRNGKIVKRVNSDDEGNVEDPEGDMQDPSGSNSGSGNDDTGSGTDDTGTGSGNDAPDFS